jgi:hypothetical protein
VPLTLVVEDGTGKSNANTFQSVADVTARLAAVPFATAWALAASVTDKQEQCAIEATALLGRLPWDGVRTFLTQSLAFPRALLSTPDGYAIASNAMPAWLLDAHARICNTLAGLEATPYEDSGLAPGTELELPGGLRLTPSSAAAGMTPDVREILRPYVRSRGTLVRG